MLPDEWLQSFSTPLFKKGKASDPTNYRPISLTATMCKIMEVIIKDQLVSYLGDTGLIDEHQHTFITNHSTLLTYWNVSTIDLFLSSLIVALIWYTSTFLRPLILL
jgi:hypothetical protein